MNRKDDNVESAEVSIWVDSQHGDSGVVTTQTEIMLQMEYNPFQHTKLGLIGTPSEYRALAAQLILAADLQEAIYRNRRQEKAQAAE